MWEPARGFWPGFLRRVDFDHKFVLARPLEIETQVVALSADETHVRLVVDATALFRARATSGAGGVALGMAVAALGPAIASTRLPLEVGLVAGGLGVALSLGFSAMRAYRTDVGRAEAALQRFCDALEHPTL